MVGVTEYSSPPYASSCRSVRHGLQVIRRRADFLAANQGLRVARPGFVLLVHRRAGLAQEGAKSDADDLLRFGITVTKRIGNAVIRNRMKRRFRALLRDILPYAGLPGHDHVLIGREGGLERDFSLLRHELRIALERAAAGKGDARRSRRGPQNGQKQGGSGRGGQHSGSSATNLP